MMNLTKYVNYTWCHVKIKRQTKLAYCFQFFKSKDPNYPTHFWLAKKIITELVKDEENDAYFIALPLSFNFNKSICRIMPDDNR